MQQPLELFRYRLATLCPRSITLTAVLASVSMLAGCTDDGSAEDGAVGTSEATGASTTDEVATGSDGVDETTADATEGVDADGEFIVIVRGQLVDADDLDAAQAAHDAIAMQGEAAAVAAGDFAHDVLLGMTILDSTENEFLAIDRWDDAQAMRDWYADPALQEAFGSLFAAPPQLQYFELAPDWVNWGGMDAGDAFDPYFFHLAIGVLAETDGEAARAAHDAVASGGMEPSIAAGNVAHVVYLGLDDPRQFVGVDIWSVGEPIEPFYSSRQFQAAFGPLFESVSEPVFQSTDWYQW